MSGPSPEDAAADTFYRALDGPAGSRFFATSATTGPWFADAQHVGPPSALLVRAIELLAAEMRAGGRAVLRARAWRLAAGDTAAVAVGATAPLPPPPAGVLVTELAEGWLPGFMDAVEWRELEGAIATPGPGAAWLRQRVPLVAGEEPSPLQRLAVAADCANGIAAPLDLREWLFVNTELTVHLHRLPEGEWIGVRAATVVGPSGIGTVSGQLHDERGHAGHCRQALVVRPRRPQSTP